MRDFIRKITSNLHRPWFGSGLGSVLVPILGLCLLFSPLGRLHRAWSYDLPFLWRTTGPITNVVVISIDDGTYTSLGQSKALFDRSIHRELIKRLNAKGAKAIVFDILFIDPGVPGAIEFRKEVRACSNVVIGAQYIPTDEFGVKRRDIVPKEDPLRDDAAAWGLLNVNNDTDFSCRELYTGIELNPSVGWQAAALAGAEVAKHPERRPDERWLNYYSPAPFQEFPYLRVLSNSLPEGTSFSNNVVFIGETHVTGYVGEEKEEFPYPWTWWTKQYFHGVEVHALSFSNLERRDWLRRLPRPIEALIIVIVGAGLGYGLSLLRPTWVTVTAIAIALAVTGAAYLFFARFNTWFPWLIIVGAQVPMTIGWAYLVDSIRSYVEKRLLERSMELYLSPRQVKEILKQPELLKPGAQEKTVSILFSDIANFSKASEILPPNDLVKLLNDYYEVAIAAVHQTGGTVMNLIGDAIFAIWNAPQEQKEHQRLACEAAVLLNKKVVQFNAGQESITLRTRIGLHTGRACVGNIGSSTHFDYAAIGESVNMASRLEGLNKKLLTNVLATREIQSSLNGALVSRFVGNFRFKGLDQINQVHEILGPAEMAAESAEWRKAFEEALKCWKGRQFRRAEEYFRRTLELRPKSENAADDAPSDGPSNFYLRLIPEFIRSPPAAEWLGEVDLREK
jgi:adenylate cyclase